MKKTTASRLKRNYFLPPLLLNLNYMTDTTHKTHMTNTNCKYGYRNNKRLSENRWCDLKNENCQCNGCVYVDRFLGFISLYLHGYKSTQKARPTDRTNWKRNCAIVKNIITTSIRMKRIWNSRARSLSHKRAGKRCKCAHQIKPKESI